MTYRVLATDKLAPQGVEIFRANSEIEFELRSPGLRLGNV